jgi:hypothetical protein
MEMHHLRSEKSLNCFGKNVCLPLSVEKSMEIMKENPQKGE